MKNKLKIKRWEGLWIIILVGVMFLYPSVSGLGVNIPSSTSGSGGSCGSLSCCLNDSYVPYVGADKNVELNNVSVYGNMNVSGQLNVSGNISGNYLYTTNNVCNQSACFNLQDLNKTGTGTSLTINDNLTIHDLTLSGNLSVKEKTFMTNVSIPAGNQLGIGGSSLTYGAIPLYIGDTADSYGRMFSLSKTNYNLSTGNTKQAYIITAFGSTGGSRVLDGSNYDVRYTGSQSQTGSIIVSGGQVYHTGTGNTAASYVNYFDMYLATNANATDFVGTRIGAQSVLGYNGTIFNYKGVLDLGLISRSPFNSTNAYNFYGSAHSGNISNAYGLYLAKQTTGGLSNQGIYLAGDGIGSDITFGVHKDSRVYWNDTNVSLEVTSNLRVNGNVYYDGLLISYSPTIFCSADEDMCMAIDYETKSQVWCSKSTGKCNVGYISLVYEKLTNSIKCTLDNNKDCLETTSKQRIEDKLARVKNKEIQQAQFQLFEKSCENIGKQANSFELWKNKPECINQEPKQKLSEPNLIPIENE